MTDFRMNSPQGKAILALVREDDYAHPGEEQAIVLAAHRVERAGVHCLLDVGCGRGGTAAWFQQHGWGNVSGVDVDAESIDYARRRYPEVTFLQADVVDLPNRGLPTFDLIYLLTAYYAFPDQRLALQSMRQVCRPGGQLLMIDYTQPDNSPLPTELGTEIGRPVVLSTIAADLAEAGWTSTRLDDWTSRFVAWYRSLLDRFTDRRTDILRLADEEWYAYVTGWYGALHRALATGRLGGCALTATAAEPD